MRTAIHILVRIAGSVVGMLHGAALLSIAAIAVVAKIIEVPDDCGLAIAIVAGPPSALVGATLGAAAGSAIAQRILRQRSSFCKALLGAVAGLLIGCVLPLCLCLHPDMFPTKWWVVAIASASIPITAGSVIGSGWKAKPPQRLKGEHMVKERRQHE